MRISGQVRNSLHLAASDVTSVRARGHHYLADLRPEVLRAAATALEPPERLRVHAGRHLQHFERLVQVSLTSKKRLDFGVAVAVNNWVFGK